MPQQSPVKLGVAIIRGPDSPVIDTLLQLSLVASHRDQVRALVLVHCFECSYNHHIESVVSMARQYIHNIKASVKKLALILSPSHLGSHDNLCMPHGSTEGDTLARCISESYRYGGGMSSAKAALESDTKDNYLPLEVRDPFRQDKMANECCSIQLIDGDGVFNVTSLEHFMKSVKLAEHGFSYAVVSIMGPQSSGMSGSDITFKMQNEAGEMMNLYILRKCSATNRLITAKDHASVQINIGHLDDNGVYTGQYTTFALSGFIRAQEVFILVLLSAEGDFNGSWFSKVAKARPALLLHQALLPFSKDARDNHRHLPSPTLTSSRSIVVATTETRRHTASIVHWTAAL
ncbi:hypothetical protein ZIOFF_013106 [Zingiber officinale]|uniref:Uncharacterized protein n=1 Tax=Zingiber officinale TaxID=94328 RepID=A0A8J5HBA7_ZINOF|nr:hypothetical protein ZIOFF_013106 [Zingiber officinale]